MREAAYYTKLENDSVQCALCPHHCRIAPGKRGGCGVRENRDGTLVALTYAEVCSVAVDPVEKKPLYHFHPGAPILSIGSWGCNLHCQFCQNWEISQQEIATRTLPTDALVTRATEEESFAVAFTYNEPLIQFEYLQDACPALHNAGLKTVLVTNGFVEDAPLQDLLPHVDAMNIDLKAFQNDFYTEVCKGTLAPVQHTIETAAQQCHVEVTTLLIPGHNDAEDELDAEARWIAAHAGSNTPVHLSAYFPCYRFDAPHTPRETLLRAREIFRQHLPYVYIGNMQTDGGSDTICPDCGVTVIRRQQYTVELCALREDGTCSACGTRIPVILD